MIDGGPGMSLTKGICQFRRDFDKKLCCSTYQMDYANYSDGAAEKRLAGKVLLRPAYQWNFDDDSTEFCLHFEPNFVLELTVKSREFKEMEFRQFSIFNLHYEFLRPAVVSILTREELQLSSKTNSTSADEHSPRHDR